MLLYITDTVHVDSGIKHRACAVFGSTTLNNRISLFMEKKEVHVKRKMLANHSQYMFKPLSA